MDEIGVMLSMLGTVKVLVGKDDRRDYRGAGAKRTMVTVIECVSASDESPNPMSIWPASAYPQEQLDDISYPWMVLCPI